MPPSLQVKLLRVPQEMEFERVGGTKTIKVDVRILAASNRRLKEDVDNGIFREDLFYRLNVVHIEVPPLKERVEDIPFLVAHFVDKFRPSKNRKIELDPEVWKGLWYLVNYTVQYNADMVRRRFTGEFDTDEWGLDWEFVDAMRPFLIFLYRVYWRVQTTGLENVPVEGRALLVVNHAGQLPWDGFMVGSAILTEPPAQRLVRSLYASLLATMPFVCTMLVRLGQALATVENGTRLLEQDELVAVFPEGYKGLGKKYADRYKLARFGRGGFVRMALSTGAPIVPVSVVGSEETYITLARLPTLSQVTGIPYLPITLTFPWLGLLGFVPLPTKWYIDFGEPIPMDQYGQDAADNLVLVSQLADQVRNTIQDMIHGRLAQRRSIFFG